MRPQKALGELDGRTPDPAACPDDEDPLLLSHGRPLLATSTYLQAARVADGLEGGEGLGGRCRGNLVRDTLGLGGAVLALDDHKLGESALLLRRLVLQVAEDRGALLQVGNG